MTVFFAGHSPKYGVKTTTLAVTCQHNFFQNKMSTIFLSPGQMAKLDSRGQRPIIVHMGRGSTLLPWTLNRWKQAPLHSPHALAPNFPHTLTLHAFACLPPQVMHLLHHIFP